MKIATANGSLITVASVGDIRIISSLTLKNVLHVSTLSTNLISIQKFTQDLRCNVIFYHDCCVFQDKDSRRKTKRAKEGNNLYYLDTSSWSNIKRGNSLPHSLITNSFFIQQEQNFASSSSSWPSLI